MSGCEFGGDARTLETLSGRDIGGVRRGGEWRVRGIMLIGAGFSVFASRAKMNYTYERKTMNTSTGGVRLNVKLLRVARRRS